MIGMRPIRVSVVIPTYNEEKHIADTLSALYANTCEPFEVIVADGRSADRTREIIRDGFPQTILVDNAEKTAAAGRNLGIQRAQGDVIAFTDGDNIPSETWIENLASSFAEHKADGIRGRIVNAPAENHYEEYWGHLAWEVLMQFPEEGYWIHEKGIQNTLTTANAAYTRQAMEKLHGFSLFMGNNAEDTDLTWRALDLGLKLWYEPGAVVYAHNVTTLRGIMKKSFRNGVSSSKLQKRYGTRVNCDPAIYKMLGKNLAGIVLRQKDAGLNTAELVSHLAGKYWGAVRYGVINF